MENDTTNGQKGKEDKELAWTECPELFLEHTCSLWQAEQGSRKHPRNKLRGGYEETAPVDFSLYTVNQKTGHRRLPATSPNANRFSKFLH